MIDVKPLDSEINFYIFAITAKIHNREHHSSKKKVYLYQNIVSVIEFNISKLDTEQTELDGTHLNEPGYLTSGGNLNLHYHINLKDETVLSNNDLKEQFHKRLRNDDLLKNLSLGIEIYFRNSTEMLLYVEINFSKNAIIPNPENFICEQKSIIMILFDCFNKDPIIDPIIENANDAIDSYILNEYDGLETFPDISEYPENSNNELDDDSDFDDNNDFSWIYIYD